MRFPRLVLVLLLAVGLLYCFGARAPQQYGSGREFHDLAAFKAYRMKLLEKQDSLMQSQQFDLDDNGSLEKFNLSNGMITVRASSRIIWQSPDDWWVNYFFLGDANNDGMAELNLLVWKEGSFGPYKPFWLEEEEEDTSIKNHLFIFKLVSDSIKPVWQSSNLDRPNYRAALIDLNNDGENELLVTEGSYTDHTWQAITLWKWNGWGFSRQGDRDLSG